MKTNEEKPNIYQKLLVIQKSIGGLAKDRNTKSQYNPNGYAYVTGSKVLENIKPLMNELGLILKQEVVSAENTRQDYTTKNGTKSEVLTKVMMKFTWVDCETGEKDENMFGANGQNDWEKGFGSALTYAERYFLLKYFHIATDEDDIDNPDRKKSEPVKVTTPAPVANTSIPKQEIVKDKETSGIEDHIKKIITNERDLIIKQKDFRFTPEGANFQSGGSIVDLVKLNDIEVVRSFYKFINKK
jgi:hypothetical protein